MGKQANQQRQHTTARDWQRARIARLAGWRDEIDLLGREWMILEALAEDLQDEMMILDLWRQREAVEGVVEVAGG